MPGAESPFALLDAAGLNRQHVFALADLPPEMRGPLDLQAGETQLILIAHAGRVLWQKVQEKMQAGAITSADPIDDYTRASVRHFFAAQAPAVAYRVLYPGPAAVDLQGLGRLAGWHHAAPFMVGIDPAWGSWFAYRAVVIAASDFPLTAALAHAHPCASCGERVCQPACPAGAVGEQFDLAACLGQRRQPASPCAVNCPARRACPLGAAHAYTPEQMRHSYGRSLQMLQKWQGMG